MDGNEDDGEKREDNPHSIVQNDDVFDDVRYRPAKSVRRFCGEITREENYDVWLSISTRLPSQVSCQDAGNFTHIRACV